MNSSLRSAVIDFDILWRRKYMNAIISDIDKIQLALVTFLTMQDKPVDISRCGIEHDGHKMQILMNIGNILIVSPEENGFALANACSFGLLSEEDQEKIMSSIINRFSRE